MDRIIFITKIRTAQQWLLLAVCFCLPFPVYADCVSGNCQSGFGIEESKSEGRIFSKYSGNWNDGKKHGKGVQEFFNRSGKKRSEYAGTWRIGVRTGQGTYKAYTNGKLRFECTGQYSNGKLNGHGKCTQYSSGRRVSVIDGLWKEDKKHGKGTYERFDREGKAIARIKARFRGDYANGTLWEYKNGKVIREYRGEFLNYSKHGKGRLKHADGKIEEGTWVRGKLVSK